MDSSTHFIASYVFKGSIAVLVELSVPEAKAQESGIAALAEDVAKHIAAMGPRSVQELLEQPAVSDTTRTVRQLLESSVFPEATVKRFVRWVAGSGSSDSPGAPPSAPAAAGVA